MKMIINDNYKDLNAFKHLIHRKVSCYQILLCQQASIPTPQRRSLSLNHNEQEGGTGGAGGFQGVLDGNMRG